ncbi:MAG: hypothetical protein ACRDO1_06375 [Nocardioidaceae bacterium]
MPINRTRLLVAVVVALLVFGVGYAATTLGARALATRSAESDATSSADRALPSEVFNAPDSVATTSGSGPVGPVSIVFPGTEVRDGLTGRLDRPWLAVSSAAGRYRAIDAPHRPAAEPGAVAVAPDGTALAWAWDGGVVLYDTVTGDVREVDLDGASAVGRFSPDGDRLAVHAVGLTVLDANTGDTVASVDGVEEQSVRQSVWTPDGAGLTYVADGRLVTLDPQTGDRTDAPTQIPADATLAWQPAGDLLAAAHQVRGVVVVDIYSVDGRLTRENRLRPEGYALQTMLGFSSDTHVSVVALSAATGALERIYRVSAVDATITPVTVLPTTGENWKSADAMVVAAEPLASSATDYEEPRWPWSDQSKLTGSAIVAFFLLGLYLTRRLPRRFRSR